VLQSVVEAHPELYHYTGAAGLKGIIIESNSFRATYFADMNDAQEIHALRVHLVDELKKRLETAVKQARLQNLPKDSVLWKPDAPQRLARVWGNALYRAVFADDAAEQTAFCCVASFCSHTGEDLFRALRKYEVARRGRGIFSARLTQSQGRQANKWNNSPAHWGRLLSGGAHPTAPA
jgi:hypothetical protein